MCVLTSTSSTFDANEASSNGGGMVFKNSDVVGTLTSLTFTSNHGTNKGGAIYIEKHSRVTVSSSTFRSNESSEGSVCYIVANRDQTVTFDNGCQFLQNKGEGTFYMFDAVLNISSSTFDDNRMSFESNGIIGMRSDITSTSNTFVNHRCDTGCYFYLFQSSTM